MKFLHTSDWHLGMAFKGGITYLRDQKYFADRICEIATDEGVDGILIAGDIFDKSIASGEAVSLYDEIITHICGDLNIPVFLIAGNHDGAPRLSQLKGLLSKSRLYISGSLEKEPVSINMGDVDIYLLPWFTTDKVRTLFPEEAKDILSMEEAFVMVLDKYRNSFIKGHKNILLAHAFIIEGQTSTSDKAAVIGTAAAVPARLFDGFDYVALGHLHGPQKITDTIKYSGTPMAYSFGREESQVKSVTIIDTDTMGQREIPVPVLHKRLTLKGTYKELMEGDFDRETLNAYLRLELTDTHIGLDTMAALREKFENVLEFSGLSLNRDDPEITMSIDELEEYSQDPEQVFLKFCEDTMSMPPKDHWTELFREALKSLSLN